MQGCKTGSGDASANLDDDKVASAEPDKAFMTQATAITEPPIPYALQASDSTARSKVCGQTNIASAAQGVPKGDVDSHVGCETGSHQCSSILLIGQQSTMSSAALLWLATSQQALIQPVYLTLCLFIWCKY